jgi:hypothetical protein
LAEASQLQISAPPIFMTKVHDKKLGICYQKNMGKKLEYNHHETDEEIHDMNPNKTS